MIECCLFEIRRCKNERVKDPSFNCIYYCITGIGWEDAPSGKLTAISGVAETYWGKNKGRSMEGTLVKLTKVLAVLFFILAAVLNTRFV